MTSISEHTYHLARYLHHSLASYRHSNGSPVAELYGPKGPWTQESRGPIVNFNLLTHEGSYIGYTHVRSVIK